VAVREAAVKEEEVTQEEVEGEVSWGVGSYEERD
jgi:hypothetical protein